MNAEVLDYEQPIRRPWKRALAAGAVGGFLLSGILVGMLHQDGPLYPLVIAFSPALLALLLTRVPDASFAVAMTTSGAALYSLYALAIVSRRRNRNLIVALCIHLMCLIGALVML